MSDARTAFWLTAYFCPALGVIIANAVGLVITLMLIVVLLMVMLGIDVEDSCPLPNSLIRWTV
jgi:hypothetical protein